MDILAADACVRPSNATAAATWRRGIVLVTLTFVYVLNFLDRKLLGILASRSRIRFTSPTGNWD